MSKDLSVLLLCQSRQYGGAEIRMAQEAKFLNEMGNIVYVMTPKFPHDEKLILSLPATITFQHIYIPPFVQQWRLRYFNKFLARIFLSRNISAVNPDLAHIYLTWTNMGVESLWLCSMLNIPTVVSIRNTFNIVENSKWFSSIAEESLKTLRGYYGISEMALVNFEKIFQQFIPNDAVRRVIYNPIDVDRFIPNADRRRHWRKRLGVSENHFLIGSIGRLDKQKRPQMLLEIFSRLKSRRDDLRLVLVGRGDLQEEVERWISASGLGGIVTLIPFLDKPEEFYPALDLHLLVSRNEGFGIVTAEAMASGVPVAGTDVPGTNEVIRNGKSGILLPKDDVNSACKLLDEFICDSSRLAQFAKEGRNDVETRFGVQKWISELSSFYEDLKL